MGEDLTEVIEAEAEVTIEAKVETEEIAEVQEIAEEIRREIADLQAVDQAEVIPEETIGLEETEEDQDLPLPLLALTQTLITAQFLLVKSRLNPKSRKTVSSTQLNPQTKRYLLKLL